MKMIRRIICAVFGHGDSYHTSLSRKLYCRGGSRFTRLYECERHQCVRCDARHIKIVEEKNNVVQNV